MSTTLTAEQILALAPDPASARAGQGLATPRKWAALGCSSAAAWGECQGSAREPYRTQVDLAGPAFRCSCPSRKFPCKHALGLMLAYLDKPDAFKERQPPEELVAKREKQVERAQKKAEEPDKPRKVNVAAQAKKGIVCVRSTRVATGRVGRNVEVDDDTTWDLPSVPRVVDYLAERLEVAA